ncbi:NUDIX hydrolase domain-like protein [Dichomitus squalens]|uniref:NUDIX hydrolase domain-like protein n=1 Tax=Dichomitus squalens TaxID=114155 RepID=A0A4Q9PK78_9APHY|nr:NUDIX hydrolase domain-like protein [Dichomitus squalens]
MALLHEIPAEALNNLSETTRTAIERLRRHQPEEVDFSGYPSNKLAAVLVLLYEKAGELRVLLTTRDKSLRAHPGQVALPGGKVDATDADLLETAYREAHEEVGLPRHYPHVYTVCTLRPYIASSKLLVTPVVALLTDLSILDTLVPSPGEVDRIFDHPLEAILDPSLAAKENLAPKGSEDWPYEDDFHCTSDVELPWLGNSTYRMHRFRSRAYAIKGLTSDILIAVAEIAYDRPPAYDRHAPNQLRTFAPILRILLEQVAVQDVVSGTSTPTPKVEVGVPSGLAQAVVNATK